MRGAVATGAEAAPGSVRLLPVFAAWRLRAYGYGIAVFYAVCLVDMYWTGGWIINIKGAPIYTDFSTAWVAGVQALHGNIAALYNPAEFLKIQTSLLGPLDFFYPNWPYPPTFSLLLVPFALLSYSWSFIAWDLLILLPCILVVYMIVRHSSAIALVLASPFTFWNLFCGQNGLLIAALLGASLLCLERRPIVAGVFIGCLTYKPQFGFLLPLALAASREWRAFGSAAATAALLVAASIVAFGSAPWEALPGALLEQYAVVLRAGGPPDAEGNWGYFQSVYGLIRYLHGGAALAWLAQGTMTLCSALIVWAIWRRPVRYALKAATLSATALLATPYAFAYDLAALAVPVAFLAKDQMPCGLLRGEQTVLLGTFLAVLALLVALGDPRVGITFGSVPIGPVVMLTILGLALRRATIYPHAPEIVSASAAN